MRYKKKNRDFEWRIFYKSYSLMRAEHFRQIMLEYCGILWRSQHRAWQLPCFHSASPLVRKLVHFLICLRKKLLSLDTLTSYPDSNPEFAPPTGHIGSLQLEIDKFIHGDCHSLQLHVNGKHVPR